MTHRGRMLAEDINQDFTYRVTSERQTFPRACVSRGQASHPRGSLSFLLAANRRGQRRIQIQFFSNKRSECHFTRIPKELFLGLSPASWLIGGALNEPIGRAHHWFIVIDSESQDAELIESRLDIQSDFHFALFLPGQFISINKIEEDIQAQLAAEINDALRNGSLNMLRAKYSKLPSAEMLAEQARITFLRMGGLNLLDPWNIENPGDALMRISRDIEYTIYRRYELLHRAIEVASVIHEYKDAASASVRGVFST